MPKYVVSDSQDETQRALDPDGANAKVSFNNSETMPARRKSRISRGKWSITEWVNSTEPKKGSLFLLRCCDYQYAYFDGCRLSFYPTFRYEVL